LHKKRKNMARYLKIFLIRHGETDFTKSGKYCGVTDVKLNSNGISQARKIAKRLCSTEFDQVYSSDLLRCFQTASIVFKKSSIIKCHELREMNFGVIERLSYQEALEKYPELYQKWLNDFVNFRMPNAETLVELQCRVNKFMDRIIKKQENLTVGIVSHSGPIKIILCKILGIDIKNFWKIKQELGAINVVEYFDNNGTVCCMNDICHLTINKL